MISKTEFWLRLLMIKGLGTKKLNHFLTVFNQQASIEVADLVMLAFTESQRDSFHHPNQHYLTAAQRWLEKPDHHMVLWGEKDYPNQLAQISCPPSVLFVKGSREVLQQPQIAVVGSRGCSHYGDRWARYFSQELSASGMAIISGLAIGVDSAAHRGTLAAEGITLAVLGSGLSHIYPRANQKLSDEIVEKRGALISEFLPTAAPMAAHFPRRNRIISGLSLAVLVIEASLRSGSLITARYAIEQGRDVFALPSDIGCESNAGGNWLIQQGAYLVATPADILEQLHTSLRWISLPQRDEIAEQQENDDENDQPIFADVFANIGVEPTPLDMIAEKSGQSVSEVSIKLLDLELEGWVAAKGGGYVRLKKRRAV